MLARGRIICIAIFVMAHFKIQSQPLHEYYFNNTFAGTSGAPALVENLSCTAVPGNFSSLWLISSLGICSLQDVFLFNQGGGLQYNNPNYITDEYTIHVFCKFNNTIGRFRLLDFSNSTSDPGIYLQNHCLNIAPAGAVGSCPFLFTANQFYLFSFVRTAANDVLTVYVDGAIFGTFNDAAKMYTLPTPTSPVVFFRDDDVVPCEAKSGGIKYACITTEPMSLVQVLTTWFSLCGKILPINLSEFNATNDHEKVRVHWKTENKDNKAFEVERSTDAEHFSKLGEIYAGELAGDFDFYDERPEAGVNYYRLKQINNTSGNKDYSAIAQVNFEKERPKFSPNPANDLLYFNMADKGKKASLKNLLGEESVLTLPESGELKTSDLPEGVYFLTVDNTTYPLVIKH
jgi:hypothetical protein